MSRVQLALNVSDLDASVAFYRELFKTEPHKRRPGKLLRSSSQASDRPITPQASVTPTISANVLRSRPNT